MQKNNELLVREGLLYEEFVIKGDNDYIELCDHIMIKYNEMHDKYNKLLDNYKKCTIDLAKF